MGQKKEVNQFPRNSMENIEKINFMVEAKGGDIYGK